jgi:hypothetical protein
MSKPKYVPHSVVTGATFTVVLFTLAEYGVAPRLVGALLWPGFLLAELAGSGAHDMGAYFLIAVADTLLYGALCLLILNLVKGKSKQRDSIGSPN